MRYYLVATHYYFFYQMSPEGLRTMVTGKAEYFRVSQQDFANPPGECTCIPWADEQFNLSNEFWLCPGASSHMDLLKEHLN